MADREIRYCTTDDGIRIAYCIEGEGPPLVVTPYFIESFTHDHLVPEYQEFMQKLGEGRRLIRYDGRGAGLSDRNSPDWTQEAALRDLRAVTLAAGCDRFTLWAGTTGGPRAIAYAARHPEQVIRMILYAAYPNNIRGYPTFTSETTRGFAELARNNWQLASQIFADMTGRKDHAEATMRVADWYRASISGETVCEFILGSADLDVTDLLPKVIAPTLLLHRMSDPTFPVEIGRDLAASIPNSRFVPLRGDGHIFFLGETQPILDAVAAFLDEDPETRRSPARNRDMGETPGNVRTIVFTDLVGHTEMMRRLGDDRGRDVLREHERITRAVLKQFGGAEVKTMGDGFMASFASVTKAMDCAIALQRAFASHTESMQEPLSARVGLNAGEPIEEDGDLFGSTVILASRIAAHAGAGEILVPDTVRGLLSGKGFMFSDRGEFVPKGFDEGVRLWDVRWQE